jgi:hypothetical protein
MILGPPAAPFILTASKRLLSRISQAFSAPLTPDFCFSHEDDVDGTWMLLTVTVDETFSMRLNYQQTSTPLGVGFQGAVI